MTMARSTKATQALDQAAMANIVSAYAMYDLVFMQKLQKNLMLGSMYGAGAQKMGQIVKYSTRLAQVDKDIRDRKERATKFKKKAWLDFCKEVIKADPRYTLFPMGDYHDKNYPVNDASVFGDMGLRRDGVLADVYILPSTPSLGAYVTAGHKQNHLTFNGFPSTAMVYPIVRAADELERQFRRDVEIAKSQHKGKVNFNGTRTGRFSGTHPNSLPSRP